MASVRTSVSLLEGPLGQRVGHFPQQRLVGGVTATQGVAAQDPGVEIDHAADQPMRPVGSHGEGPAEQVDGALVAGAPQEDELPLRWGLQVQLPFLRKRSSRGRRVDAGGSTSATGSEVARRLRLQGRERLVLEAGPDLGLPTPVEALDRGLEPVLLHGREDDADAQAQTQAHHAPDHVAVLVGPLEARVVVELGIGGPTHGAPVRGQASHNLAGTHPGQGPGDGQAAMQGDAGQDLDLRAVLEGRP